MIAYLDCSSGISGDKLLGALLDAGGAEAAVREGLRTLGLDEVMHTVPRVSHGVRGTGVEVRDDDGMQLRTWGAIRGALEGAPLPSRVRERSLATLRALAEAEARVHGVAVDEVHFHEIGAADTLVDVVGTVLALEALRIERLHASPVALGSGTVRTAHGVVSVPAPATALLVHGMPIVGGETTTELTTPTGAALLRTLVADFGPPPAMTVERVGFGVGTRDIGAPNVALLLIGSQARRRSTRPAIEDVAVLTANLDHLSPEHVAHAADRLREAGALDAWTEPIVMKKGRSAVALHVLVSSEQAARFASRIMAETGSLGVRVEPEQRYITPRHVITLRTDEGPVRFKVWRAGGQTRVRVEHDDAARIARSTGCSIVEVAAALDRQAEGLLKSKRAHRRGCR